MSITIIGMIVIIIFAIVFLMYTSKGKKSQGKEKLSKENEMAEEIKNSHKVAEKNNKGIPQKDMADFMEFDKIADNMIIQNGGKRYTMAIQCKGINYDLMSEIEQMGVEEGFITFLNTLKYPVQLYVQARAIDLKQNLNIYKNSVKEIEAKYDEISDKYRNLTNDIDAEYSDINKLKNELDKQAHILGYAQDITRYVERISLNKNILQRKFYIVLSYNRDEIASTTDFSEQEIYSICYRELYTRAQSLISALMGCSVVGNVLTSNELAELLYISYNRDDEKLLDIKTALESGFYRLYSTSKDVFEKKEEAMQKEVEEEAKRRVQDAIKEVIQNQETKTPDELIEEYEKRVDKEALNIIDESDTPKEAKKMLKDTIVENHVIGVETRKMDRKIRKQKPQEEQNVKENLPDNEKIIATSENGKNTQKNTQEEEKLSDKKISNENIVENEINQEMSKNVESDLNKKEDNDEILSSRANDKNNEKLNITTSGESMNSFFDDRLSENESQDNDDAGINI